jgi:hypothetical protein
MSEYDIWVLAVLLASEALDFYNPTWAAVGEF